MKYCYTDFAFAILDYFSIINRSEFIFEWGFPFLAAIASFLWGRDLATDDFLKSFISILTNVFAILVGFTMTAIAIFTTADIEKNKVLGKTSIREIHGVKVEYFRFVYINLIFSSVAGLAMIALTLASLFFLPFVKNEITLLFLVFGTLLNLFLGLRNATNLYFIFFRAAG